jgi:hypothetical protein
MAFAKQLFRVKPVFLQKYFFSFHFLNCVYFKLPTRRWVIYVISICDIEKIEGQLGRMHFQK